MGTNNIVTANRPKLAAIEQYGNLKGDYAQIEQIMLDDLRNVGFPKLTVKQVKADTELYDAVVDAYWDRLSDTFDIPEDQKALWWLMPGRYKKTGGDISKITHEDPKKQTELIKTMNSRVRNLTAYGY